jgi:indole-3-acetate monooxygenase
VTAFLAAARGLEPLVNSLRDRFDQDRKLPPALVDAMAGAGLFGMWKPRALGGPELAPLEMLTVIEELARQDASVGWCAVIPAGYSRLSGAMEDAAAREVFCEGRGVLVGALTPSGKAIAVPGGWRVTGRWSYGSFIEYSDWVLGNCVTDRATADGPEFRLCLFPRAAVEVFDIWHVGGLRATGSNDFAVTDLFVPEALSIPAPGTNPPPRRPEPLYAIPLPSTFVSCIVSVMLGAARAAIESVIEIAASKTTAGSGPVLRDRPSAQADLAKAEALLRSGRAYLFDELGAMWNDTVAGRPVSMQSRAQVRLAAVNCGQCAIGATDLMYQLAGGVSLFQGGRLERSFRDVHAAGQHFVMSPQTWLEPIGKVLFGLPPGTARF